MEIDFDEEVLDEAEWAYLCDPGSTRDGVAAAIIKAFECYGIKVRDLTKDEG